MKIFLKAVFLAGLLAMSMAQLEEYNMDCRRPGDLAEYCLNAGSTCLGTGQCSCGADFQGVECEQPDPVVDCAVDTTLQCAPNGVCGQDGAGAEICYCKQGYYFDEPEGTCLPRVQVPTCTSTQMTMLFKPYGPDAFSGFAQVEGAADIACRMQESATVTGALQLTLDYTGSPCGDAAVDPADNTVRSFNMIVQYDVNSKSDLDQLLTFSCKVLGDGESQVSSVAIGALTELDAATELEKVKPVATSSEAGLTVSLLDAGGNPLTGAQTVGTEAILRFSLDLRSRTGFEGFWIKLAEGTATGAGAPKLNYITEGCGMSAARHSMTELTSIRANNAEYRVDMKFKIIKFIGFVDFLFNTDVVLCETEDCVGAAKPADDCTAVVGALPGVDNINRGGTARFRRRKRQASRLGDGDVVRLNVSTLVTDGVTFVVPEAEKQVSKGECLQSLVFLLPLILLSVMLIVAMLCAVYFCLKLSKQKKYDDRGIPNMAYKS